MAMATKCVYDGRMVDVNAALELRSIARRDRRTAPRFTCEECGKPVRVHKESKYGAAHFEHHRRNPSCNRSHHLPSLSAR